MKTEGHKMFQCAYCVKEFKYKSEKKRHEQSHTEFHDCKVCNKRFNFISALRRHEKQHNRKDKVHCEECGGAFRDETLLKRHMKYAHKGTFTCKKCNSIFNSEAALKIHSFRHKPENERRYKCNYKGCQKSFNFKHHLKHHVMMHQNTKQHFCNTCGKGFIQLHHLKSHLKIHDPDKWLYCIVTDCNKKFPTEYSRKRHMMTLHSNITDFNAIENLTYVKLGTDIKHIDYDKCNVTDCDKIENGRTNSIESNKSKISSSVKKNQSDLKLDFKDIEINKDLALPCKALLGSCLVTGTSEVTDDCLCAQISTNSKEQVKEMPVSVLKKNQPKNYKQRDNTCTDCNCMINDKEDKTNNNDDKPCKKSCDTPAIEYKLDGTVKLKETFDTDIPILKKYSEPIESKKKYFIPFNSCKAVLGNCIVSEDGKVGEGCLCAKMAMYDDQENTQEIDEITPLNLTEL